MKIAVIGVQGIPAHHGEIERYCQEFYPRIADLGHQVDLFVQSQPNQQPWFSVGYYHNVRTIALTILPSKTNNLRLSAALSTVWATLTGYDVIHIQGIKAAWFAWFPQLLSRSKIIVTSHHLDIEHQPNKLQQAFNWLSSLMERIALKNADQVVVTSKALGEYLQKKYQINPRYIPNAPGSYNSVNLQFNYGTSLGLKPQKYILFLGKLIPENQPDVLIKAFQNLAHEDWKLLMAGEIGSIQYAVKLLNLAKDNQNIIFTNEVKSDRLAEIINHAGMLVMPNSGSNLGLPLNVLEAMQAKIPIVASNSKVYEELIGEKRGLLFETDNVESLVAKLNYALAEPSKLKEMAHQAQSYVTINHNWDRVTYGNLSLYLKVTEQISSPSIQHNV